MPRFFKSIMISLIAIVLLLSGCGRDEVKEDIENYINTEIPKLADIEKKAISGYTAVTGSNYTSDDALYGALTEEILPSYGDFITGLEKIKPTTPELQKLHEQYVTAANNQQSAFIMIVSAIEKQDSAEIASANEKLANARQMVRDFQTNLFKLADSHGIKLTHNEIN
ncbi:hypothetical protein ACWGPW_24565 [Paenibacillus chitinolyticus]